MAQSVAIMAEIFADQVRSRRFQQNVQTNLPLAKTMWQLTEDGGVVAVWQENRQCLVYYDLRFYELVCPKLWSEQAALPQAVSMAKEGIGVLTWTGLQTDHDLRSFVRQHLRWKTAWCEPIEVTPPNFQPDLA